MKVKRKGKKLKTKEEFFKIFEGEAVIGDFEGVTVFEGLRILSWYSENLITCAKKDLIYSVSLETLLEEGITDVDAKDLRKMNWGIEDGTLYGFV